MYCIRPGGTQLAKIKISGVPEKGHFSYTVYKGTFFYIHRRSKTIILIIKFATPTFISYLVKACIFLVL